MIKLVTDYFEQLCPIHREQSITAYNNIMIFPHLPLSKLTITVEILTEGIKHDIFT